MKHIVSHKGRDQAFLSYGGEDDLPDQHQVQSIITSPPPIGAVDIVHYLHRLKSHLRDDGTLWLHLGKGWDLPWGVALSLHADGWYLRSDIIWAQRPPNEEFGRLQVAHEYIFLLTKSPTYFYDHHAIKEPHKFNRWGNKRTVNVSVLDEVYNDHAGKSSVLRKGATTRQMHPRGGRNKRSVWYAEPALGDRLPVEIVTTMIRASTSQAGACSVCYTPANRVVDQETYRDISEERNMPKTPLEIARAGWHKRVPRVRSETWDFPCGHQMGQGPVPCVVFDPFAHRGVVGEAAVREGVTFIGHDASEEHFEFVVDRIANHEPDEATGGSILDLFGGR